ncbi:HD-GYP domain-containing protein [Aeromonas aquatilis]
MDNTFDKKMQIMHVHLKQRFDKVNRVSVAIYDQQTDKLKTFTDSSEERSPLLQYEAKLSDVPSLQYLVANKQPKVIDNLSALHDSDSDYQCKLLEAGCNSSYAEPLWFNNKLIGFLFCNAVDTDYFDEPICNELSAYAQSLSSIIAKEFMAIQILSGTLKTALEFSRYRDEETANHLIRMSAYSQLIAKTVAPTHGLSNEQVEFIYRFSGLHDIGKLAVPDAILLKPGKLTPEEFKIMMIHPVKGREMITLMLNEFGLSGLLHTDMIKNIICHHHERFDGKGYPDGLAGEAIPLEARIVTVADVFDALSSARPYKRAWSFDAAFAYLEENAGSHLDPACVAAALQNKAEFHAIYLQYQDEAVTSAEGAG